MAALLVAVLASGTALVNTVVVPATAGATPPDDPGRGLVHRGLNQRATSGVCAHAFNLAVAGSEACTHGPDAAPPGLDVRTSRSSADVAQAAEVAAQQAQAQTNPGTPSTVAADPSAVACYGDGSSGNRVQLVYARSSDVADRYSQIITSFQQAAAAMDAVFNASAAETGGVRHVRFVTDAACHPTVANVVMSTTGDDDFGSTVNELRAQGYTRSDRKYLVWVDANVYCGIAQVYSDEKAATTNTSNGITSVQGEVARVDNGCWALAGQSVEAHEVMHTLGGVQTSAPNSTPYNHCSDEYDRMCYSDGSGVAMRVVCPSPAHDNVFDCNHDDYFNTAPPAGSYLATHWNTANSSFISSAGTVLAWGYNGVGDLGNNTAVDAHVPVLSAIAPTTVAVSAGAYHSLALRSDGTVWAWGWNILGQLGDGTTTDRWMPQQVPGLTSIVAVAAGGYHNLALRSDGTVWAWGYNAQGEVGDGTVVDRHLPVQVSGLSGVKKVAAGTYHSLAVLSDGTVRAWGWNAVGQLGNGTANNSATPVVAAGMTGVTGISGGAAHSLAVRSDGSVWSWGWNSYGQLGDNTVTDHWSPAVISGLTGVASVAAGYLHSVARLQSGAVKAWGWNGVGQLGDNTVTDRHAPVTVSGLSGVTAVAAGFFHDLAVRSDGSVVAWGWNAYGQLGDNTVTDRHLPVAVPGASTAFSLAGGGAHSLMS
jgi:alpha-tubulin suppressor-like RCC1 family protein